jgi:S1-C subfamily serine protease
MRSILCVTALLAGILWSLAARAEVDHTLSLSVVQVRAYPGAGRMFFGSGVVVGPDQVVTNCHVTRGAIKIFVSKGPQLYPATAQRADVHRDLCLLTTPDIPFPAARLGTAEKLAVGQPLYFYGYPRAIGITFSEGKVQGMHPFENGKIIETTADFTLGASGGGIFDDSGKLVGLATFLTAGHVGGYYAIPVDWVGGLKTRPPAPVEPVAGKAFWEDTGALPAFLKLPEKP